MDTYEELKEEAERNRSNLGFQDKCELRALARMLDDEAVEIGDIGIMCAVYGWLVGSKR